MTFEKQLVGWDARDFQGPRDEGWGGLGVWLVEIYFTPHCRVTSFQTLSGTSFYGPHMYSLCHLIETSPR